MATVRIIRNSEYMNKYRKYSIYIDGAKAGAIGNAETTDIVVSEGTHTIYAKLDFGYSQELTFHASDKVISTFNVSLPPSNKWIMLAIILLIVLRPLIQKMTGFMHLEYFYIVLSAVYVLYIFTVGKRKRLVLTQDISTNDYVPYSK